jgi:ABC-type transport system substrate-binding protein
MKGSTGYKYQLLLLGFAFLFVQSGCNLNGKKERDEKYGSTLHINASDVPDIIFPGQVLKLSEQLIVSQVYAGLLKYNPRNLELEPQLAENWQTLDQGLSYRFELVNNAFFHNDACFPDGKGRKIVASDIKYSIEQICHLHLLSQHELSKQIKNIKGAEVFQGAKLTNNMPHIDGIKVLNDTLIEFELNEADPLFEYFLASTNSLVFPPEAFNAYGFNSTVGSGAYTFNYAEIKGQAITLIANPNYFVETPQQERLPFIDTIQVSFITSPPKELMLFEQDKLDLVLNVNEQYISQFLDKNIDKFQSNPPYFIMKQTTDYNQNIHINFIRANVHGLYLNSLGYFDLSIAYFMEPVPQQIKIGE